MSWDFEWREEPQRTPATYSRRGGPIPGQFSWPPVWFAWSMCTGGHIDRQEVETPIGTIPGVLTAGFPQPRTIQSYRSRSVKLQGMSNGERNTYELQVRLRILDQLSSSMAEIRNRAGVLLSVATIVMGLYAFPAQRLLASAQGGEDPDPISGLLQWGALMVVVMYLCVLFTAIRVLNDGRSPFLDNTQDILSYSTYSPSSPEAVPVVQPPWERVERYCADTRDRMNRSIALILIFLQFEVIGLVMPWFGMILRAVRES